jgi:hypothetical protein
MTYQHVLFCAALSFVWNHQIKAATFIQQDTLRQDTICITPYFAKTPVRSLGNFAVVNKDRYAFQTYAGFSVLNTLRGHVPGGNTGPNAAAAESGLRSVGSMLVIDGLPYADGFAWNYNLNAFDYENIYALSSGNALIPYGGQAGKGAVFLQSKTGKNIFKPSVEFNSSPGIAWLEETMFSSYTEQLQFTNAVAYAQDYGAVDLRVSYNGTYYPMMNRGPEAESSLHNIRVNTGIDITDRLNARLILDGMKRWDQSKLLSESDGSTEILQGNLMLQYQAMRWLTLTSQSSLAGITGESNHTFDYVIVDYVNENRRSFLNLFATARHTLSENFSLREFAGVQYDGQKIFRKRDQFSGGASSGSQQEAERRTRSLLAGIGIQYNNYWFADLDYRLDEFSAFSKDGLQPSYALTSAFVFSDALQWQNKWFASGKLRASYGKTTVALGEAYPGTFELPVPGGVFTGPGFLPLTEKRMIEAGTDLSFFNRRVDLSVSYFHDLDDQTMTQVAYPNETGYTYRYGNVGELSLKGWEATLSATTINRDDLSLRTGLTWSDLKNYIVPGTSSEGLEAGVFRNRMTDWTGSLLNQLTVGNFFGTFLVDMRRGEETYGSGTTSSPASNYFTQNVKLRDISIGYSWPEPRSVRTTISLSARNLWNIYPKDEKVAPVFYTTTPQKSINLSVTLGF